MKIITTWDLGTTKCAAAIVQYDEEKELFSCLKQDSIKLTDFRSLQDVIHHFEKSFGIKMSATDAVCIGAAGQYDGEQLVHETSYPFPMQFAKIAKEQNWPPFAVIHDYAPVLCATFTSYMYDSNNVRRLNHCPLRKHGRRIALGIGTGLGLKDGVLFRNGDFWLGQNEMGHIGIVMPPSIEPYYQSRHKDLVEFLKCQTPNETLTFEKILTGRGLVRLYQFLHADQANYSPEEIGEKIRNREAGDTLALFAWYLGLFVGTVQLSFMPEEGIWITGGVVLKYLDLFDRPDFFHGIEASPAYLTLRQQFPLGVLCNHEHAFMGGAYYAIKRLVNETIKC